SDSFFKCSRHVFRVYSEAAAYEFTTLTAIPGTLHYRGARIQILDLPGIIEGARDGKGRGRQVIAAARTCNMLLIVLDAAKVCRQNSFLDETPSLTVFSFAARDPLEENHARVGWIWNSAEPNST